MTPVWEIAVHLAVACDVSDGVLLCYLVSPLDVLEEIWDLSQFLRVSYLLFHADQMFRTTAEAEGEGFGTSKNYFKPPPIPKHPHPQ